MRRVRLRDVVFTALIVLGLPSTTFFLVDRISTQAHKTDVKACQHRNAFRDEFIAFLQSTVDRSEANARATIAAPVSTAEQRMTAQRNLDELIRFVTSAEDKLPREDCGTI